MLQSFKISVGKNTDYSNGAHQPSLIMPKALFYKHPNDRYHSNISAQPGY
jgi:hypothetical protein